MRIDNIFDCTLLNRSRKKNSCFLGRGSNSLLRSDLGTRSKTTGPSFMKVMKTNKRTKKRYEEPGKGNQIYKTTFLKEKYYPTTRRP